VWDGRYFLKVLAEFVMSAMAGRGWSVDQTFTFIDRNFWAFLFQGYRPVNQVYQQTDGSSLRGLKTTSETRG